MFAFEVFVYNLTFNRISRLSNSTLNKKGKPLSTIKNKYMYH
jgi:hypothetical protein